MILIKIQFWIYFSISTVLYRLCRPLEKMGIKHRYMRKITDWHRIWRAGDRYYQNFKILPYIPNMTKQSKILYVGVQGQMDFNIRTLIHLYPHITFLDIDKKAKKYVRSQRFVVGAIQDLPSLFGEEKFDCVIISGVYYFYPELADDFLDITVPIIADQLNDKGIFITGIYNPSFLQHYNQCMDSPIVQKYFKHTVLNGKSIHKAYRRLHRKTWDTYNFEVMQKKGQ